MSLGKLRYFIDSTSLNGTVSDPFRTVTRNYWMTSPTGIQYRDKSMSYPSYSITDVESADNAITQRIKITIGDWYDTFTFP